MASFLTEEETILYLNSRTNSIAYDAGTSEVVFFTVPPTKAGTDGTELAGGGYERVLVSFGTATAGSSGRTGQVANDAAFAIENMPVASIDVVGYALAVGETGRIWFVKDDWTPTEEFAVGGTMNVPAGALVLYSVPEA